MPMDTSKYLENWPAISLQVRTEAGMRCERCSVANYAVGARDSAGMWWSKERIEAGSPEMFRRWFDPATFKLTRIVLTVAHLDHDTANGARSNLAALCQRCHLNHDREQHEVSAVASRERKRDEVIAATGQQRLW
jgi:hypothetical protein